MNKNILVIAPHPDDEILGAGGTIARHIDEKDNVFVCVVTERTPDVFGKELPLKVHAESQLVKDFMRIKDYYYLKFPSIKVDTVPQYKINNAIENVIKKTHPNIIYTCCGGDINIDHKQVFQSTLVACRPKGNGVIQAIYSYETLSETEWDSPDSANYFKPNYFVDISKYLEQKTNAMEIYASQKMNKYSPREWTTIKAHARIRGSTINVEYAEAFILIRGIAK